MLLGPSAEPDGGSGNAICERMYMFVRAMMNGATPTMRENATLVTALRAQVEADGRDEGCDDHEDRYRTRGAPR